jgi:hypothetical protein
MGIHHDVEEGLEKYETTKIDGQPTDEDLNLLLATELINAAGSVATQNGGGEHGHIGMVVKKPNTSPSQEWQQISGPNKPRTIPSKRQCKHCHSQAPNRGTQGGNCQV